MAINLSYSTEQRKYQGSANEALLYGVNQLEERALKNQTKVDAFDDHLNTIQSQLYSGYTNDFKTKTDKYRSNIKSFLENGDMADIGDAVYNWSREIKNDEQTNNQITSSKNFNIYSAQLMQDDKIDPIFKKEFFMPNGTADQLMANGGQKPVDIKEFGNLDIPQQKDIRGYLEKIKAAYLPNSSSVSTSDLFASDKGQEKVEALGLGSTIGVDANGKSLLQSGRYSKTTETITYDGLGKIIMKQMTDPKTEVGAYINRLAEAMTKVQGKTITPEDIVHSYADNEYDSKTGNFSIDEEQTRVKSETSELETNWMYNLVEQERERNQKLIDAANKEKQDFQSYYEYDQKSQKPTTVTQLDGEIAKQKNDVDALIFKEDSMPPTQEQLKFSTTIQSYIDKKDYSGLETYMQTANDPKLDLSPLVPIAIQDLVRTKKYKDEIESKVYGADYQIGMNIPIYGNILSKNKTGPTRKELITTIEDSKLDGEYNLLEKVVEESTRIQPTANESPNEYIKRVIKSIDNQPNILDRVMQRGPGAFTENNSYGEEIRNLLSNSNSLDSFANKYAKLYNDNGSVIKGVSRDRLVNEVYEYSEKSEDLSKALTETNTSKEIAPVYQFANAELTDKVNDYIIRQSNMYNVNIESSKFQDESLAELEQEKSPILASKNQILNLGNFAANGKFYVQFKRLVGEGDKRVASDQVYHKEIPATFLTVANTDQKTGIKVADYNYRLTAALLSQVTAATSEVDLSYNLKIPLKFKVLTGDPKYKYSIITVDRDGKPVEAKRETLIDMTDLVTRLINSNK